MLQQTTQGINNWAVVRRGRPACTGLGDRHNTIIRAMNQAILNIKLSYRFLFPYFSLFAWTFWETCWYLLVTDDCLWLTHSVLLVLLWAVPSAINILNHTSHVTAPQQKIRFYKHLRLRFCSERLKGISISEINTAWALELGTWSLLIEYDQITNTRRRTHDHETWNNDIFTSEMLLQISVPPFSIAVLCDWPSEHPLLLSHCKI